MKTTERALVANMLRLSRDILAEELSLLRALLVFMVNITQHGETWEGVHLKNWWQNMGEKNINGNFNASITDGTM